MIARRLLATCLACTLSASSFASLTAITSTAHAEGTAADKAAARSLFDQAKTLVGKGDWPAACPLLEESQRLDPHMTTLYRLGDCYEHIGKTASAWITFHEAASLAKSAGDPAKAKAATERADALESTLPRVSITVVEDVPGLTVKRDGAVVGRAQWSAKVPVDPGKHVFEASAPGYATYRTSVDVASGATVTVEIPAFKKSTGATPAPSPAAAEEPAEGATQEPAPPPPEVATGSSSQKTLGLIIAGVGVIGLGAGVGLGFAARSKYADADALCPAQGCTPEGKQQSDDARSLGNVGTVVFVVGAAAAVTGLVLYLTAPKSTVTTAVGIGPGTFSLRATF